VKTWINREPKEHLNNRMTILGGQALSLRQDLEEHPAQLHGATAILTDSAQGVGGNEGCYSDATLNSPEVSLAGNPISPNGAIEPEGFNQLPAVAREIYFKLRIEATKALREPTRCG
jgi:hypothetical protein